jgi:toxin-antitoxin system PIN domain toxin
LVIVDANVLLYAVNESIPQHGAAKRWVEDALSGDEAVGFAWVVLLALLRIITLPALSPEPLTAAEACDLIDDWLDAPPGTVVAPTMRHPAILRGLLLESGTAGNLTSDAHLAALAIEHGARVCTFDRDFHRFRGVRSFAPTP